MAMMHHYEARLGTIFNYDPDLGGEVLLRPPGEDRLISVPAADLVEFLDHVRALQAECEAGE